MSSQLTSPDAPAGSPPLRALRRAAFTLVEMLVVVLLISVLAGMVFKLTGLAGDKAAKATTLARLERLKTALEEFYAEYGQYPPVPVYPDEDPPQPFRYEYADEEFMDSNIPIAIKSIGGTWAESWSKAPVFTFGLMSFLVTRYQGYGEKGYGGTRETSQWGDHNTATSSDQPRDSAAVQRWAPILKDILHGTLSDLHTTPTGAGYTNGVVTVLDGWGREFHYESPPPHQTYRLFSGGPDCNPATASDNIEGHAGH